MTQRSPGKGGERPKGEQHRNGVRAIRGFGAGRFSTPFALSCYYCSQGTGSNECHSGMGQRRSGESTTDVLGYRVTFPSNSSFVKITPLTSRQDLQKELEAVGFKKKPPEQTQNEDENYRVISDPEDAQNPSASMYALVMTPKELEEDMTPSMIQLRDLVIDGLVGLVDHIARMDSEDDGEEGTTTGRRRGSSNRRNVSRRRRRNFTRGPRGSRGRGPVFAQQRSEPSMYEVVEVDYETISRLKAPNKMDWRVVPRYELGQSEVARQEKELYYLMTSEEGPEEAGPGEPTCCVCHENMATRVVVPCGHRCLCYPCALHLAKVRSALSGVRLPKKCPICQAAIGHMLRIR